CTVVDKRELPAARLPCAASAPGRSVTSPLYPKHVWSPSGGWYAQPANWKRNTAVLGGVVFLITAAVWKLSAEKEYRHKMPEPGRFYPSRYWSRQIIEYERAQKANGTAGATEEKK
ncbi:hypothetical protein B0T20DRAFT_353990, partial [Sordaria brevicollis]